MKTVDIQSADATEDFELSKGRLLLVEFLDEAGNPIPNVGVGVRGWRRSQSLYNHKHPNVLDSKIPTKSDSEGIFEWQWAPDDAVDYALYAEGYRTVERTLTADDSIQSVILTK